MDLPAYPGPVPRPQAERTARELLTRETGPMLMAMTDGDGGRLVLFTRRSGYIASPEQAAALLYAGLPFDRLITTAVAPRMAVRAAKRARPGLRVTETPVGFKHIVTAWQNNPKPTLSAWNPTAPSSTSATPTATSSATASPPSPPTRSTTYGAPTPTPSSCTPCQHH
ncbi:hypothetical protein [Streptomyces sp. NPDC092903]|uniref:hypothetical protein n=1 Tax=Streptomyces sp. NPDC092903 TaxID=3366017 RepID=UPI00381832C1